MGSQKTRQIKTEWLLKRLDDARKENREVEKNKLLAMFSVSLFSTKRTGQEILEDLELAGTIKSKGNKIWINC